MTRKTKNYKLKIKIHEISDFFSISNFLEKMNGIIDKNKTLHAQYKLFKLLILIDFLLLRRGYSDK